MIGNVTPDRVARTRADCKRRVTFLPSELATIELVMHPGRRGLLKLPHDICKAMGRFEAKQQVHMVSHTADFPGDAAKPPYRTSQVLVQLRLPRWPNQGLAILGREHYVVVQAQVGRGHGWFGGDRRLGVLRLTSRKTGGISQGRAGTSWCWHPSGMQGRSSGDSDPAVSLRSTAG